MKLYADAMLGKLGRFLRILGYDTLIASSKLKDSEILEQCLNDGRVLLTKDKLFFERMIKSLYQDGSKGIAIYVDEPDLEHQLLFVFKELDLDVSNLDLNRPEQFIKRCSNCNSLVKPVKKETIREKVNQGTLDSHEQFWRCTNLSCRSVFWIGNHWQNIRETLLFLKTNYNKDTV